MLRPVLVLLSLGAWAIRALFLSRSKLLAENLALRQQVCGLKRERPRPPLDDVDRAFWVALRAWWPGWANCLVIVDPDTVTKWHRQRFLRYWARISQRNRRAGRPRIDAEIRRLIRVMAQDGTVKLSDSKVIRIRLSPSKSLIARYNESDFNRKSGRFCPKLAVPCPPIRPEPAEGIDGFRAPTL